MGLRYEWADDRQIIMNIYIERPWTWAEYHTMITGLMDVLRDVGHPCALAVDCSKVGSVPRDGNFLNILMNTDKMLPDNHFATMVVAAPYIVSTFMNMTLKLRPTTKRMVRFTRTMAEAHAAIYAQYQQRFPELASAKQPNTK